MCRPESVSVSHRRNSHRLIASSQLNLVREAPAQLAESESINVQPTASAKMEQSNDAISPAVQLSSSPPVWMRPVRERFMIRPPSHLSPLRRKRAIRTSSRWLAGAPRLSPRRSQLLSHSFIQTDSPRRQLLPNEEVFSKIWGQAKYACVAEQLANHRDLDSITREIRQLAAEWIAGLVILMSTAGVQACVTFLPFKRRLLRVSRRALPRDYSGLRQGRRQTCGQVC